MTDQEAGRYWNENAEAWTILARAGFDIYRDCLNTPAFFDFLPSVKNLHGIDIGCGEGHNTRLLALQGAKIEAIDISEIFIQKAVEEENITPLNIRYQVAGAGDLPFQNNHFDFATSFMCFMDIPEIEPVFKEAFRVLKPGGFLQFSISHPCFETLHRKNVKNLTGATYAVEVGDYFKNSNGAVDEWIFKAAPSALKNQLRRFRTPKFTRTLSEWLNTIIQAGLMIEQINEPYADDETVKRQPKLQACQIVPYFLHIRCRKPK